jgi:integrase
MASISKHRDGWRAQVYRHGQRASKVLPTKREAQAWALRKEVELDAFAAGGGRTFADLAGEYLRRVTPGKRSVTWEERAVARLRGQIGDRVLLVDLDSAAISRWRDARLETVSGSTVQREANLLRNMVRVARDEWRWQVADGFRGVRMPAHNAPRRPVWTWQLIKRVLRAPRTGKTAEMQRAFRIALHTSLRLQEVLTHEYDAVAGVLVLPRSKTNTGPERVPTTRRARRILPTTPFTVRPNEGSVLFSRLCRELLIEGLTFHDARASALTWMARRMDVLTLSRISRHRDISLLARVYYRETAEQVSARV